VINHPVAVIELSQSSSLVGGIVPGMNRHPEMKITSDEQEPLRLLGRRHAGYGVNAADYDTVAGALLGTLEQALGSEFTPAVRDAWVTYYQTLAGEMKAAAPRSR
jgi:hemoglobin-like flavoprotein